MRIIRNKMLHVAVPLFAVFWPVSYVLPPVDLYVFLGSVLFTVSIAVVHAYWQPFKMAVVNSMNELEPVDWLTFAVVLGFTFIAAREAYITFYREFFPVTGRSDDYYLPLAFIRYGAIVSAFCALAALSGRGFFPGWPRCMIAIGLGSILGLILIYIHP